MAIAAGSPILAISNTLSNVQILYSFTLRAMSSDGCQSDELTIRDPRQLLVNRRHNPVLIDPKDGNADMGSAKSGLKRILGDTSTETTLRLMLKERRETENEGEHFPGKNHTFFSQTLSLDAILTSEEDSIAEEELALRKSLIAKRRHTADAILEAMEAAKLGTTYSKQIIPHLSEFIDLILMKAVTMKRKPKYANLPFSARVKLCIERTKVVAIFKWLKHNKLTTPRIGNLVSIAGNNLDLLQPRIQWLKKIGVKGRDLGLVLSREPAILWQSDEKLNITKQFLVTSGVRNEWLGFVVSRCPTILSLSYQELEARVKFFMKIGVLGDQFGAMVFRFPAALGRFALQEMQAKVDFLKSLGVDDMALASAIASRPQLLAFSVENSWQPLVKYLYYIGIDSAGIKRIFAVQPAVFCLNLADNIAPKVRFLRAIGVYEEVIGHLLVKFPAFLTYSLDRKIRPVVRLLLERAGVSEDHIGKVIAAQPELIGCSMMNKLEILVKFFLSKGISKEQLGDMIANFPMLLKYNIDVIQPKYMFFKRVMRRLIEEVIIFPRFFSYALESRIIPRHNLLAKKGLTFSLKYMLACSDSEFLFRVSQAEQGHVAMHMDEDLETGT